MSEFLTETYAPCDAPGTAALRAEDIALTAGQVSQPGAPVRFLGAIILPEEETCFYLYRAPSADAVRAAMTRARLRPERITPVVAVRPPRARREARRHPRLTATLRRHPNQQTAHPAAANPAGPAPDGPAAARRKAR